MIWATCSWPLVSTVTSSTTRCVWKLYAKGEDTAAGNKAGANHRGDGDHVDVATADDAAHLLVAAVEMLEGCKW